VVCGLILLSNFSTSAILFATCLILIFVGRVRTKYILSLLAVMLVTGGMFYLIAKKVPGIGRFKTVESRIETFLGIKSEKTPDNVFQVNQAKIAIATGGIVGKFPGNSTQRNILPQAFSDFIFAIIIEEYGLIGAIVIIFLYLIILYRGIRIASKCDKFFGTLLCLGISFVIVFQAMINMGVTLDLLPNTGQTLPMISHGGTSIWLTSIGIGILLSISRANDELEKQKKQQEDNAEIKINTTNGD
jgi:cell division protein FtsW